MGAIIKIPVADMQIGTDMLEDNIERFLRTAYDFFIQAYSALENNSKEEFIKEVEEAPATFGVLKILEDIKPAKRINGWQDLKLILSECVHLLDDTYYDDFEYRQNRHKHILQIRTKDYIITIQRDLQPDVQRRVDAIRVLYK